MAIPAGRELHQESLGTSSTAHRRARFLPLLALVAAIALGACNSGSKADSASPKVTSTAVAAVVQSPAAADKTAQPTQGSTGRISDEPVAFQTDDGVTIHGHLYSSAGPKQRVVIFAHMYPNDQRAWQPFAKELAAMGIAALTFDFRGYGESSGTKDPSKVDHDLTYALLFMESRDYPLVYLVGASMGGTAVLKVAAAQEVAGIVTVSAPVSFMGLDAQPSLAKIRGPKLILASKNEAEGGGQSAAQIYQAVSDPRSMFLFDGTAHGTDLLQGPNADAFKQKIIDFVEHN